ncbi:hypothetical protein FGO68_gene16337 [Halteria grandinella]|uniref:Uncharacterized protein n=1 Tax=Halteria grandinella TaxID=5974 RepID=A0A8J8NVA5_HALGN|nr:hypothetical protein FGO68_gene16337 [Halteria grandinella]
MKDWPDLEYLVFSLIKNQRQFNQGKAQKYIIQIKYCHSDLQIERMGDIKKVEFTRFRGGSNHSIGSLKGKSLQSLSFIMPIADNETISRITVLRPRPPPQGLLNQSKLAFNVEKVSVTQLMHKEQPTRLYLTQGTRQVRGSPDKAAEGEVKGSATKGIEPDTVFQPPKITNVNEIIHLTKAIEGEKGSDNMRNLDWILKLRQEEQAIIEARMKRILSKNDTTKPEPPQVYFKSLNRQSVEDKDKIQSDLHLKGNLCELYHIMSNRRQGPTPSGPSIQFLGSLRYGNRPASAVKHSHRFITGATKSKARLIDFPEFLPPQRSESKALLSKISSIKKVMHDEYDRNQETISGFESRAQAFPQYEDKQCFRTANTNDRLHLIQSNKQIQTIAWETNLRLSKEDREKRFSSVGHKRPQSTVNYGK